MSKFRKPTIDKDAEPVKVGTGLLNDVSKKYIVDRTEETVYIDMDIICSNKLNKYTVDGIEKLADAIKMSGGILQDLIVKPLNAEGFYEITTGERRWRAAQLLKERGEYPEELKNKVPCKIKDPDSIPLPLDKEKKEKFSILVTNQYREKTDGDKLMEVQWWKEIIDNLRTLGIEYISFSEGNLPEKIKDLPEEIKDLSEKDSKGISFHQKQLDAAEAEKSSVIQIKGNKTRDIIAQQVGISTGQVSRFENIGKNGSQVLLERLANNQIDVSAAEEIVNLEKEEQEKLLGEFGNQDKITLQEIKKKKSNLPIKKITVSSEEFQKEIGEIISGIPENVELNESDYKKYRKCVTQLRVLLG